MVPLQKGFPGQLSCDRNAKLGVAWRLQRCRFIWLNSGCEAKCYKVLEKQRLSLNCSQCLPASKKKKKNWLLCFPMVCLMFQSIFSKHVTSDCQPLVPSHSFLNGFPFLPGSVQWAERQYECVCISCQTDWRFVFTSSKAYLQHPLLMNPASNTHALLFSPDLATSPLWRKLSLCSTLITVTQREFMDLCTVCSPSLNQFNERCSVFGSPQKSVCWEVNIFLQHEASSYYKPCRHFCEVCWVMGDLTAVLYL